jgi:hypothetical protein
MTIDEAIKDLEYGTKQLEMEIESGLWINGSESELLCKEGIALNKQHIEWLSELKEARRLLRLAINDFAKLDRENTRNKKCMMPEMDCTDCPLSWDSVDDRVEPCHSWRYENEALKLIQNS